MKITQASEDLDSRKKTGTRRQACSHRLAWHTAQAWRLLKKRIAQTSGEQLRKGSPAEVAGLTFGKDVIVEF
jgi:hypothetical protein